MKPSDIKEVTYGLRKQGKLIGVSKSGVITQLAFRGYPKSSKLRFDPGSGVVDTTWIIGVLERREGAGGEGARGQCVALAGVPMFHVPSPPQTISKIPPLFLVKKKSLQNIFMETTWNIGTLLHETKRPT